MSDVSSARTGVIHDIGFRHYEGPRLGAAAVRQALFAESAKGAFGMGRSAKSKIMPTLIVVAMCLPPVIIAVIASVTKLDELPVKYTSWILAVQPLIVLFAGGQAPASVSRDLRFRTTALYFSRPLSRLDYVTAKYAALATALFILMAAPLTILFVGALLAKMPLDEQAPNYLRAMGGAALAAVLVAGIALLIASVTPRRGLGVAAVISALMIIIGVQGALMGIAHDQGQLTFSGYSGLISPFSLVHGIQHSIFGGPYSMADAPPGAMGGAIFVAVYLAAVAALFGALVLRYRKVSI
jgi:ABC-2 type transport system permease protein